MAREQALDELRSGQPVSAGGRWDGWVNAIFEAALAEGLNVALIDHDGLALEVIPCSPEERGSTRFR